MFNLLPNEIFEEICFLLLDDPICSWYCLNKQFYSVYCNKKQKIDVLRSKAFAETPSDKDELVSKILLYGAKPGPKLEEFIISIMPRNLDIERELHINLIIYKRYEVITWIYRKIQQFNSLSVFEQSVSHIISRKPECIENVISMFNTVKIVSNRIENLGRFWSGYVIPNLHHLIKSIKLRSAIWLSIIYKNDSTHKRDDMNTNDLITEAELERYKMQLSLNTVECDLIRLWIIMKQEKQQKHDVPNTFVKHLIECSHCALCVSSDVDFCISILKSCTNIDLSIKLVYVVLPLFNIYNEQIFISSISSIKNISSHVFKTLNIKSIDNELDIQNLAVSIWQNEIQNSLYHSDDYNEISEVNQVTQTSQISHVTIKKTVCHDSPDFFLTEDDLIESDTNTDSEESDNESGHDESGHDESVNL